MTTLGRYILTAARAPRAILGLALLLALPGGHAAAQSWSRSGLDGKQVTGLARTADGGIMAATGAGIFRSTDNGASWSATDMTKSARHVVAAPNGDLYAAVSRTVTQEGLARSTDGGRTWQVSPVSEYVRVMAVDSSGAVLTGGMDVVRRSTDGGVTWSALSRSGMPDQFFDFMQMAVGPGGMIVVGNGGITGGMIYGSLDGGETWQELYKRQGDYGELVFTPTGAIVATLGGGAIRSTNYGETWASPAATGSGMLTAIDLRDGRALGAGSGGVYRSTDDGATWTADPSALPSGTIVAAVAIAADGSEIIATFNGVLRNGAAAAVEEREADGAVGGIGAAVTAWPNPTMDRATIHVAMPRAGHLRVTAIDMRGRPAAVLADGAYGAGTARIEWNVSELPAGVYRIVAGVDGRITSTAIVVAR